MSPRENRGAGWLAMPAAPLTASPVPELTSLHGTRDRGHWGDARYRGNCDGHLIKKLVRYFRPGRVLDPMSGSGTCGDVCRELGVRVTELDVKRGQDAGDPSTYEDLGGFDFVWMHPPYWRQIVYSDDPRCLSRAPSLEAFGNRLQLVLRNAKSVLNPGGKVAVLIGGYSDRGRYQPLPAVTIERAAREGLSMACTEIIRLQHGNTSSWRKYESSFIPGLHDQCLVFDAGDPRTSVTRHQKLRPRGRRARHRDSR